MPRKSNKRAECGSSVLFGEFVFKHECHSFCDAYVNALTILGEEAKNQWTREDVVKAVLRAALTPGSPTGREGN